MKRLYFYFILCMLGTQSLFAQQSLDYDRSSLYPISLVYDADKFATEITSTILSMEVPDKFNDHALNVRVIPMKGTAKDTKDNELLAQIRTFLDNNNVGRRMVARWFNRDKETGAFNIELLRDRGNYNASVMDVATAMKTVRGRALIEDAGEQLIGSTFIVVNEISYIDKESNAEKAQVAFQFISGVFGSSNGNGSLIGSLADFGEMISSAISGFTVNVKSYLFQLDWNDEVAAKFYDQYYFDASEVNPEKKAAFENDKSTFKLKYIGSYSSRSSKTVTRGLHNNDEVFMKVLTRATDENIVELQRKFPVFKVVSNVASVENKSVYVQIGLKEGVSPTSKYEVLQRVVGSDGHVTYTRKAVIKPVGNKIWDNRCMAVEEMAENANLNATEFECTTGSVSAILPGMIVREIKI